MCIWQRSARYYDVATFLGHLFMRRAAGYQSNDRETDVLLPFLPRDSTYTSSHIRTNTVLFAFKLRFGETSPGLACKALLRFNVQKCATICFLKAHSFLLWKGHKTFGFGDNVPVSMQPTCSAIVSFGL